MIRGEDVAESWQRRRELESAARVGPRYFVVFSVRSRTS